jgi:GAF domain-containing protein
VQIETEKRPSPFSVAAIPLRRSERTTGVLVLKSSNADYFSTDDVSLLQSLAAIAAVAIERSKLARHLQEVSRLALTATRYEDLAIYVVKAVRDLTGAAVALWMMSSCEPSQRRCLRIDASAGKFSQEFIDKGRLPVEPDASLNAQALHSGTPLVRADMQLDPNLNYLAVVREHDWHSFMAAPLFGREREHLGVLSLYDQEIDKFRDPDVQPFSNIVVLRPCKGSPKLAKRLQ